MMYDEPDFERIDRLVKRYTMTIEEVTRKKMLVEAEIANILVVLMKETGCQVTAVGLTTEEGFGFDPVLTAVNIKLEIK